MLKILHNRVDALTLAYRVRMTTDVAKELRTRGRVAYEHGRAAISIGDMREDSVEGIEFLDWELRFSRTPRRWNLTRVDHVRALVDLQAPGAVLSIRDCGTYMKEVGDSKPTSETFGDEKRFELLPNFKEDDQPGWTLELVYYAQYLADHSLASVIDEARRISRMFGTPFEERVRRCDLAVDVQGWTVRERDRAKLVTRSRAVLHLQKASPIRTEDAITAHVKRKLTGLTVGSGALLCRLYDKREELRVTAASETDNAKRERLFAKVAKECARWRAGGWDGTSPVLRVEFQLKGEALREMGIKRADGIIEPIVQQATDVLLGSGEVYTLGDYIPRVWSTCIKWLRLVVPTRSRSGDLLQRTRWRLDPRWKILHGVDWGRSNASDKLPIKRLRKRAPVSASQAVGAMASLVAARGFLEKQDESPEAYKENPSEKLLTMLRALCAWGVEQMAIDLVERWGDPEKAALHLAIRLNAARARFPLARGQPDEGSKEIETWLPSGQPESEKLAQPLTSLVTNGVRAVQTTLNWASS